MQKSHNILFWRCCCLFPSVLFPRGIAKFRRHSTAIIHEYCPLGKQDELSLQARARGQSRSYMSDLCYMRLNRRHRVTVDRKANF